MHLCLGRLDYCDSIFAGLPPSCGATHWRVYQDRPRIPVYAGGIALASIATTHLIQDRILGGVVFTGCMGAPYLRLLCRPISSFRELYSSVRIPNSSCLISERSPSGPNRVFGTLQSSSCEPNLYIAGIQGPGDNRTQTSLRIIYHSKNLYYEKVVKNLNSLKTDVQLILVIL